MRKINKFSLSATACAFIAILLAVTSFAAIKLGDADGDEKAISVSDARQILRFAVNLDEPKNDEIRAAADVDRDGNITVTDARTVLRAAVNLDTIPDEPAIKQEETTETEKCEHNFVYKPIEETAGYSDWSNGTHIETCTKCGVTRNKPIACTFDGDIEYFKDSNGNDILPTCEKAANYYQTCSVCGGKKQNSSKKLQHKFNSENAELATVTKTATCTEAGEITVKCEMCKKAVKKITVRALGHVVDDKTLAEGETVKCSRCGEVLKPETFDYDDNELLTYLSGKYYFSGKMKTIVYDSSNTPVYNTATKSYEYEESEVTIAINPGQSIYMMMPIDESADIGYLAFTSKNLLGKTVTEKYFETEYEGTRYYFHLDNSILKTIGIDSSDGLSFPEPSDPELNTKIEGVDLRQLEQAQVVYQGNVCTRLTYSKDADNTLRFYMNGKKLLLVETLNKDGIITGATYFDTITSDIPKYMTTTDGKVLSGVIGLMEFAGYLGMFAE